MHEIFLSLFFETGNNLAHDPVEMFPMLINLSSDDGSWGKFNKLSGNVAGLIFCLRLIVVVDILERADVSPGPGGANNRGIEYDSGPRYALSKIISTV